MTSIEREALLVAGASLQLAARRMDDAAAEALDLLAQSLCAAGEDRILSRELLRNVHELHAALLATPRGAPPGTFLQVHSVTTFG